VNRVALITGLSGQDGSYLAEFLLDRDYDVHGLVPYGRRELCDSRCQLHYGDLTDASRLAAVCNEVAPDEVYNLGAQSHVRVSFDLPVHTADVTGLGTLRVLEAIRQHQAATGRQPRFYQASSSEMFGNANSPQNETTRFHPRSPYACAKVFAYWQTVNYREAYGLFAANGILFNHESPRRGEHFVTRKITRAAARIKLGLQDRLALGNIDAQRDWGFAGDYVEAMWLMLQHESPDDFVIATGKTHSVRNFLEEAFGHLDLDYNDYVDIDQQLFRPTEVDALSGDASKAETLLGWKPRVSFSELVRMMTEHDLQLAQAESEHQTSNSTN
jgi:GDPmannose 4,6-dehydratase